MTVIQGLQVVLRRATEADVGAILDLLCAPGVAEWWPGVNTEDVRATTIEGAGDTVGFVIEVDGVLAGFIQHWEEDDPVYRHAGIDVAMSADYQDRGFGTDAVRAMVGYLLDELGHHRVVIDPAAHNARAIRAYEKVGFKPVGVMRRYERAADGTWHDGLLMDVLRDDLMGESS